MAGSIAPAQAPAATPAQEVTASRAQLERAVRAHEVARKRLASIEARSAAASAELDALIAEQDAAEARLASHAATMYRTGRASLIGVLMNADTFEGFSARWALLERVTASDAAVVEDVESARSRATREARKLVALQEDASRETRALAKAKATAEADLAKSRIELAAFRARTARTPEPKAKASPSERAPKSKPESKPAQQPTGSGAWKTGVASHYGRNFRGRGASGARIGPDSMIVAHKTLPFGTLVEFSYNGKRAVAKVVDRGPHSKGRMWDLGPGVIRVLGFNGVHTVKYRVIGR